MMQDEVTPPGPQRSGPPPLPPEAALFIDFDGTLAPLAPRPQDVQVPEWVLPTLRHLHGALGGAVAVISGRPVAQIDGFLAPLQLPAAGVHGVERRGSNGLLRVEAAEPPAPLVAAAQALVAEHPGLLFEPKTGGFALHFRSRPLLGGLCHDTLQAALRALPEVLTWQIMGGHCVYEIKQRKVSKGVALAALQQDPCFAGRLPVYVGDDVTDEDGIAAAQAAGGFGVRVGPGATQARYWLEDIDAVSRWLGDAVRRLPAPGGGSPPPQALA
ncbi:trehalose-phosphatase [Aquincola tertiaricarbonis]|uniref:Trehalose 6-phosphate phosphatase n=1 Tax=Aquincola tertiaricarbonis TaxID=391953 RepID=A0ABY4S8G7_AQUTE|nr:trehalose-phosphatase [Aquincola tertiaricarbonis]URI09646.1 trehalose-phosphatase [Aquincola tertiaricarbonis]